MEKKNVITPETKEFPRKSDAFWVFLAGPIQGAPDWQFEMPDIPGILWVSPRRFVAPTIMSSEDWSYQTKWETEALRLSDMVLFWIPKEKVHIPDRHYAQTTRTEIGEILGRGIKKVVLGVEPGAISGAKYFGMKLEQYGQGPMHETLEGCLQEIQTLKAVQESRAENFEYFTSDTHFSQARTLALSQRPFNDVYSMDWAMIERWNSKVPPQATVWHLGDFGDLEIAKYLNGQINLIKGNYERNFKEDISQIPGHEYFRVIRSGDRVDLNFHIPGTSGTRHLVMHHEPLKHYGKDMYYSLFGHIHGRQKVKRFGIDVGVDAWNYTPVDSEEIEFLLNALDMGYYDEEVFCG